MAKRRNLSGSTNVKTHSFVKGLQKDSDFTYVKDGMWTHARNATNNTIEGNLGSISNASSNQLCATAGATMSNTYAERFIIGAIHLYADKWVIYTVGHDAAGTSTMSEIGLLEEDSCNYRPIVQDACLKFDKRYLIDGASREAEDCTWQVYWCDGLNPDRYLNIGDPDTWPDSTFTFIGQGNINYYTDGTTNILWPGVAWKQDCSGAQCQNCIDTNELDCVKTRMAKIVTTPTLKLSKGVTGGNLLNGTYFVVIAYLLKGQKVTDYFAPSNTQPIYSPEDAAGSLVVEVEADTVNFDEFVLVVVQNVNQGTVARQVGTYSTQTNKISIDLLQNDLITVPISQIPLSNVVFEKSKQIEEVNNYLLRVGPTGKFDFNYQPLANLIRAKWASVEYPADYYVQGGNKGSYLRDEVYAFFIRWIYDTGDRSASYHIPGRPPKITPGFIIPGTTTEKAEIDTFNPVDDQNTLYDDEYVYNIYNTAQQGVIPPTLSTLTDDGGTVIATGDMGYWQSTESYPDKKPNVWNSSAHCWTNVPIDIVTGLPIPSINYDLCGQKIRHHKFPDNCLTPDTNHFKTNLSSGTDQSEQQIRLMGVYFENITYPKDNDGNDIEGIVGYEILRGSREGNKSIIAKGMLNNFRTYQLSKSTAKGRTGLYANYPFNTVMPAGNTGNSSDQNYQYNDPYIVPTDEDGLKHQDMPSDIVSFHSPDTMFTNPDIHVKELKTYGFISGFSEQAFNEPDQHPKWKLLSNFSMAVMITGGLVRTFISLMGKKTYNMPDIGPGFGPGDAASYATTAGFAATAQGFISTYNAAIRQSMKGTTAIADGIAAVTSGFPDTTPGAAEAALRTSLVAAAGGGAVNLNTIAGNIEFPEYAYLPTTARITSFATHFFNYFSLGADNTLKLIKLFIPLRQFALQMKCHGFYDKLTRLDPITYKSRFNVESDFYLRDAIQEMPRYQTNTGDVKSFVINNLKRSDSVVIRTTSGIKDPEGPKLLPNEEDQSLTTLGMLQSNQYQNQFDFPPGSGDIPTFKNSERPFSLPIASHYAGIKYRINNQYGQLDSIKQIQITPSEQKLPRNDDTGLIDMSPVGPYLCGGKYYTLKVLSHSPVFFGGDTFINRYTEKNTMLYFYDWLYGQPDEYEYNYGLRYMIPNIRFSANSQEYDVQNLAQLFNLNNLGTLLGLMNPSSLPNTGPFPTNQYHLDNKSYDYDTGDDDYTATGLGLFGVKNSAFYLATSSIRDFYVESDVLVDFRREFNDIQNKHYDPYRFTDYAPMFDMDPKIISKGNTYNYDYSFSFSKLYNQYFSSGNLQNRNYDPDVAKLCYVNFPNRIMYSLPQQDASYSEAWLTYLVNNYKDFKHRISGVKNYAKTGIFITFDHSSPLVFQGVDTLKTDLGTKITLGDGGLFANQPQLVSAADQPFEYGSCQNNRSIISSPGGFYFMSQDQGKIFAYANGLNEISQNGMKWWFDTFLPYQLLQDFPDYPYTDNPVCGIGCQSLFDNDNTLLYFCKKDYKLKPEFAGQVTYDSARDVFIVKDRRASEFKLGDSTLFDEASWTISFDPKSKFFISFHDWHPDLILQGKNTWLTTKNNQTWKHNNVCNDYCKYYGKNYPFELEIPASTGQSVTTLKSVEYILESYKRAEFNCFDQFHVLDFNFDEAVIYNTEQVSGYLNLNLMPKNNPVLSLEYPKYNVGNPSYDILFSKEENKYRFNQFWDITKDRGEFPVGAGYPPTASVIPGSTVLNGNYNERHIWLTKPNGYVRELNSTNLNYQKSQEQRKRFRHYTNFISLKRNISGPVNMIVKMVNTKSQLSQR